MINHKLPEIRTHLVVVTGPDSPISNNNEEFISLVLSAGSVISGITYINVRSFNRNTLIGKGKIDELKTKISEEEFDLIVFSHDLIASQERNLEKLLKCPVIDRTRLILDIFAKRAQSSAGKLQVELAQLNHLSTRLVRGWTHLERQKGGIGLRGPGEKQLETDRRLLGVRIKSIKARLKKIEVQRAVNRKSRIQSAKTVALVGYTNAGKSTLFNALTSSETYAADKMFATLDPLYRPLKFSNKKEIIVSDTVGFIRDLPDTLVQAFLSTLEELRSADLILHVLDVSDRNIYENKHSVEEVLKRIDADTVPVINVCNKIDLIRSKSEIFSINDAVQVSAQKGLGLDALNEKVISKLEPLKILRRIKLDLRQSRVRSEIYQLSNVIEEIVNDDNQIEILCEMDDVSFERLKKNEKIEAIQSKIANH
ncbi:MAG: GTPase HflX [Gammaproteobacteria bacterium]|mgnify:CR=1 FL=1|nr:GTPase HflX [Gammaproteobacteria bacterium]MBQ08672.1 GTPase HflX [Gammaproteobacteria bacterium]MDP6146457.1 GTPase HflX [Gammaproteobacteria bacterium]HJL80194.1 GTPase HflX [Gammaproteobacteria bacterium]HJM09076.1 GTPase HflX [Gammaproteobacteria bacterium]